MNRTAVDKAQLFEETLHDDIVAMGIDPQVSALFKCPVDAEGSHSLFGAVPGDSVDDAVVGYNS